MENMMINCIQCGTDFEFSVNDQIRHREMNFDDPKRCPDCRKRKSRLTDRGDKKSGQRKKFDDIMYGY
jgi:hypothetical protein